MKESFLQLTLLCALYLCGITSLFAMSPGDFEISKTGEGAIITKYRGKAAAVLIPETIGGLSVTGIGGYAFAGCNWVTQVELPASVTEIGAGAFLGCSELTSIKIPCGVTSIKNAAFSSCRALTEVTIPEGVTSIGQAAFFFCINLKAVTIPISVTHIGKNAFMLCYALKNVSIGANVQLEPDALYSGLGEYYSANGKKAGNYNLDGGEWSYEER